MCIIPLSYSSVALPFRSNCNVLHCKTRFNPYFLTSPVIRNSPLSALLHLSFVLQVYIDSFNLVSIFHVGDNHSVLLGRVLITGPLVSSFSFQTTPTVCTLPILEVPFVEDNSHQHVWCRFTHLSQYGLYMEIVLYILYIHWCLKQHLKSLFV